MGKRTLSLYIDESGVLDKENPTSRFYLISLVAHNADDDVAGKVKDFKRGLDSIGIANACFHAGPIIYGNDQFRVLNWDLRRRIFSRMMGLVRRIPFTCTCLEVDKHFCDTTEKVNAGSVPTSLSSMRKARHRGSTYSCKWLTSLPRCASSSLRCGLGCR